MLHRFRSLENHRLLALDGEIGWVRDLYFDDRHWTVRYLVADTGQWLPGRPVLISPYALGRVKGPEGEVEVRLTREQVRNAPSVEQDQPVSRAFERAYYQYYGWPFYWAGPALWGTTAYPVPDGPSFAPLPQEVSGREDGDPHLRSVREVLGYHILARDGEVGHVEDLLVDDATWAIRYFQIDTRNWLPGPHVLLAPGWTEGISWPTSQVMVGLTRETLRHAPPFEAERPVTREYEAALHSYYNRQSYWETEQAVMPERGLRHS